MSGKALPIQHLYCSQADYSQICKVTVEAIDAPTTPLIHQMSRFWLFTGGRGTIVLQDRQYEVQPGTLVSVLPWQISDVVQVEEPLQYYLLAYYFDNVNMAVKALGQGLTACQWTADGVAEALIHETLPVLGVQYHPERQSFRRRRDDAADAAALFRWWAAQVKS